MKGPTSLSFLGSSPSPRPTPAGRGRIALSLTKIRATGFAERSLTNRKTAGSCSLSQRERVRVRESGTNIQGPFTFQSSL